MKIKALVLNSKNLIDTIINFKDSIANSEELWIKVDDLGVLKSLVFFINECHNCYSHSAQYIKIFIITDQLVSIDNISFNTYFITNQKIPHGLYDFFIWNIDKSSNIQDAMRYGYKKFYNSVVNDKLILNINSRIISDTMTSSMIFDEVMLDNLFRKE